MSKVIGINFRKLNEAKETIPNINYKPYITKKEIKQENILRTIKVKGERKKIWG